MIFYSKAQPQLTTRNSAGCHKFISHSRHTFFFKSKLLHSVRPVSPFLIQLATNCQHPHATWPPFTIIWKPKLMIIDRLRLTAIYAYVDYVTIDWGDGLSPDGRQAITSTDVDILSFGASVTNFYVISIEMNNPQSKNIFENVSKLTAILFRLMLVTDSNHGMKGIIRPYCVIYSALHNIVSMV